ncbi:MAG: metallophosphoesterase [Coprothermobacterota bacterium]|nr:metallophosphoesterase [Coprothermobacterota bacterium]
MERNYGKMGGMWTFFGQGIGKLVVQLILAGGLLGLAWLGRRARRRGQSCRAKAALLGSISLALLLYSTVEPAFLRLSSYSVTLGEGAQGSIRLAFLSDPHLGVFAGAERLERAVCLSNQQQPDLVLLGGDFLYRADRNQLEVLLQPLAALRAPLGIYAVLGNHDYGAPGRDLSGPLEEALSALGIRVLHNQSLHLGTASGSGGLTLVAIDDERAGRADLAQATAGLEGDGPLLLMAHNADFLLRSSPDRIFPSGTANRRLWLFGHTHGGQARLPLIGPLYRNGDSPWVWGLDHSPWGTIITSAGLGETSVPLRFACPPEVVVVDLRY